MWPCAWTEGSDGRGSPSTSLVGRGRIQAPDRVRPQDSYNAAGICCLTRLLPINVLQIVQNRLLDGVHFHSRPDFSSRVDEINPRTTPSESIDLPNPLIRRKPLHPHRNTRLNQCQLAPTVGITGGVDEGEDGMRALQVSHQEGLIGIVRFRDLDCFDGGDLEG